MRNDQSKGSSNTGPGSVSRGEEALFGALAGGMRQVSLALASIEDAQVRVGEVLESSRDADGATEGPRNEHGRSDHTEWLVTVWERINDEHRNLRALYQELASEAIPRWMKQQGRGVPVEIVRVADGEEYR